jgi:chromosome partitioning protein
MRTVSIINSKGGLGKTTLSLHLASFLARDHRVLLIDLDHQSSLSMVILGSTVWSNCATSGRTINRVFASFCNGRTTIPDGSIVIKNAMLGQNNLYPSLDFVSAQFELDDTEIDLSLTYYENVVLSDWEKRTLLAKWLDNIGANDLYDYIVIDCPPATKIVSQNAIAASNSYVIPVIPEDISSRGVTHFKNLVKTKIDDKLVYLKTTARVTDADIPHNYIPATRVAAIVPFIVKTDGLSISSLDLLELSAYVKSAIVSPAVKDMMNRICTDLKVSIDR